MSPPISRELNQELVEETCLNYWIPILILDWKEVNLSLSSDKILLNFAIDWHVSWMACRTAKITDEHDTHLHSRLYKRLSVGMKSLMITYISHICYDKTYIGLSEIPSRKAWFEEAAQFTTSRLMFICFSNAVSLSLERESKFCNLMFFFRRFSIVKRLERLLYLFFSTGYSWGIFYRRSCSYNCFFLSTLIRT